jgi:hypothetical protein
MDRRPSRLISPLKRQERITLRQDEQKSSQPDSQPGRAVLAGDFPALAIVLTEVPVSVEPLHESSDPLEERVSALEGFRNDVNTWAGNINQQLSNINKWSDQVENWAGDINQHLKAIDTWKQEIDIWRVNVEQRLKKLENPHS